MAIPSRITKRNQDLKLLSYMQRSKKLNKNFYQPIEWSTQQHNNANGNKLPRIGGADIHETTVQNPNQEAHLPWKGQVPGYRGKTVPSNLKKHRYTITADGDYNTKPE